MISHLDQERHIALINLNEGDDTRQAVMDAYMNGSEWPAYLSDTELEDAVTVTEPETEEPQAEPDTAPQTAPETDPAVTA